MVILITGASHVGKTLLAQKMLEKYKYPSLSIDHLKMGLIRCGYTDLKQCNRWFIDSFSSVGEKVVIIEDDFDKTLARLLD